MSFKLEEHIKDHAYYIANGLETNCGSYKHFNTSCHTAYFIKSGYKTQKQIDTVMIKILKKITQMTLRAQEKNGICINKKGQEKQKYRVRKIKFHNVFAVYHNEQANRSKNVNPHFHF